MRRYLLTLAATTLLAAGYGTSYAQETTEPVRLSLEDCMSYAIKHNYSIKNAQLDVSIQKAQNDQTTAAAYPKINGQVELDDNLNPQQAIIDGKYLGMPGTKEKFSFTQPYTGTATITGSQVIFDGSVLVALQARNTVMALARQQGEVNEVDVRYNVYKAYYALVIAYRQFDIIKKSLESARRIEHDVTVTQQNGFAEKIDVERTQVQVNNLATDSLRIGNLLTTSEQALKYRMGMDINTPIILTDTSLDAQRQGTLALLNEQENYSKRPEFSLLQIQQQLNEYNIKRYKLAAIPSLSAFGTMGYNYYDSKIKEIFYLPNYLFYSTIGLRLNIPIFNGLQRIKQLDEARLDLEKTKNNIDNMKLTIDFQTAQGRTTLRNAVLQVRSQRRNLELANDVLDLARKKYKAGVGSNMEVTQAQTDQLQAQTNYFNAQLDVINAEADLKKALGLLK